MGFLNAVNRRDRLQQRPWNRVIHAEHHHGITTHDLAAHLHRGHVDVVLSQHRAEPADDSRHIAVAGEEHVATRRHIHGVFVNAGDAQFAVGEHSAGDTAAALIPTGGDLERTTGEIAAAFVLDLKDLNAAGLGLQRGIDEVDAVTEGSAQQTLQRRDHQGLGRMVGELALESQFQLLDVASGKLTDEQADGFRQLQMRLEPLHDFGTQTGNVDGAARRKTQQHVADLFRHIDGDVFLRFLGRGTQVRGQNEPALHSPQRRILRQRLTGIDVKTRPGDDALIDRLSEPKRFLATIPERLRPGGYLVIASPYTWLEEYTAKSNWLGGIKVNGETC